MEERLGAVEEFAENVVQEGKEKTIKNRFIPGFREWELVLFC